MTDVNDTINQAADKLMHAIEAYGPKATDLALETGRVAAYNYLITNVVALILSGLLAFICYRIVSYCFKTFNDENNLDFEEKYLAGGVMSSIIGIIASGCSIMFFFNLFSVWAWVGISHPELYLVHKMLGL